MITRHVCAHTNGETNNSNHFVSCDKNYNSVQNSHDQIAIIETYLNRHPRVRHLSAGVREEVVTDVLQIIYVRKLSCGEPVNGKYVDVVLKYRLRWRPRTDPYVRKARRRYDELRRWGRQVGTSSLDMTRRSPEPEPIDRVLREEEAESDRRLWAAIVQGLQQLEPRQRAVLEKFLRGEKLSQSERCLKYRAVQVLKARLGK